MHALLRTALAALAVGALAACGGGGGTGMTSAVVSGKITDAGTGADLAGVTVTDEVTGARTRTDAAGRFRLEVAPGARVRLDCEAEGESGADGEETLDFRDELPPEAFGYDDDSGPTRTPRYALHFASRQARNVLRATRDAFLT